TWPATPSAAEPAFGSRSSIQPSYAASRSSRRPSRRTASSRRCCLSRPGSAMAEQMKGTPMYKSYVAVAPNPKDFPRLLDRMGELMRRPVDWSEDVKKLSIPVMLVFGDADMIRPEHIVQFYQLLGGGLKDAGWQREHMSRARLAIIPDVTHYEMFLPPPLAPRTLPFLDGKSVSKTGAEQVKE